MTLNYYTKKAELSWHSRLINQTNLRPYDALLLPLTYNISSSLISLKEPYFNPKYKLTTRSLLQLKSRLLYNTSLTLICADLPLGSIRQQIQQINYQLPIVGHLQESVSLRSLCHVQRSLRQLLIKQRTTREYSRKIQRLLSYSLSLYKKLQTSIAFIKIISITLRKLASRQE